MESQPDWDIRMKAHERAVLDQRMAAAKIVGIVTTLMAAGRIDMAESVRDMLAEAMAEYEQSCVESKAALAVPKVAA